MLAPVSLSLTEEEHKEFQRRCHSGRTSARRKERLSIVLLADEGSSNNEICECLPFGIYKIARLRKRVMEYTTNKDKPPKGATHWTTRTLASRLHTNHMFVARVWKDYGFKPHLMRQFKIGFDPGFEEKLEDVVGLYLNPPENAVVFSVDEKSSIQALDRTLPGLPMKPGRAGPLAHEYKRHGTSTLFAALNVFSAEVIDGCKKRHRHQEFLLFLKAVEAQTPEDKALHVIVDTYSTHKHTRARNWLKSNPRVVVRFILAGSSWLNIVERFFGLITEKQIRRGVFSSVKDLGQKSMEFIEAHNTDQKPFKWIRTTDAILEKIERAKTTLV